MKADSSFFRLAIAAVITALGAAMTTAGAITHAAWLNAPGATAIVIGAGWLGSALAHRHARGGSRAS